MKTVLSVVQWCCGFCAVILIVKTQLEEAVHDDHYVTNGNSQLFEEKRKRADQRNLCMWKKVNLKCLLVPCGRLLCNHILESRLPHEEKEAIRTVNRKQIVCIRNISVSKLH